MPVGRESTNWVVRLACHAVAVIARVGAAVQPPARAWCVGGGFRNGRGDELPTDVAPQGARRGPERRVKCPRKHIEDLGKHSRVLTDFRESNIDFLLGFLIFDEQLSIFNNILIFMYTFWRRNSIFSSYFREKTAIFNFENLGLEGAAEPAACADAGEAGGERNVLVCAPQLYIIGIHCHCPIKQTTHF